MKVHKEYPKLFRTLSRLFGARKSVSLINKLKLYNCNLSDCHDVSGAFVWGYASLNSNYSEHAVRYWSKVANASLRIKGFKPLPC